MSPYLFTMVMEVLNLILKRRISQEQRFKYHWRCTDMKITHLCFADDLLVFSHADIHSVKVIKQALEEFKDCSGLIPNLSKSTMFFGNVGNHTKEAIKAIMPFREGQLPVKYLGVPLLSKRLYSRDCKHLIDKVKTRIGDWRNKF